MSALAEHPDRVRKIFLTQEVNEAGCYAVTLIINGEPRTVCVDDNFPFCPFKDDWAFSKSIGNELWVLLIEKAWAKVFGSY